VSVSLDGEVYKIYSVADFTGAVHSNKCYLFLFVIIDYCHIMGGQLAEPLASLAAQCCVSLQSIALFIFSIAR